EERGRTGGVRVVDEHDRKIGRLVEARRPQRRHGRAEGVVAVAGKQHHVLVRPRQFYAERRTTAPAAGTAAAAEVRAGLNASRVGLYEAAVTQPVVEDDG